MLKGRERGDKLSQDPSSSSPFHSKKKNGNGGRYRPGRATSLVTAPLMLIFPLLSFSLGEAVSAPPPPPPPNPSPVHRLTKQRGAYKGKKAFFSLSLCLASDHSKALEAGCCLVVCLLSSSSSYRRTGLSSPLLIALSSQLPFLVFDTPICYTRSTTAWHCHICLWRAYFCAQPFKGNFFGASELTTRKF